MILITTSHRPSPRTRSFAKDLASVLPGARKVNRGHKTLVELALEAKYLKLDYVMVISEKEGNPRAINVYEVTNRDTLQPGLRKVVTLVLKGVKLSRENPEASKAYNVVSVNVDSSSCISDDCFFLADLLMRIFSKLLSSKPNITFTLEESKYITLKCINVHGKPVGPVISIVKVVKGEYR